LTGTSALIDPAELGELEARVTAALARGDDEGLTVLGYGEISCVLRWPLGSGARACKRLPRFRDQASFDDYRSIFERYVAALTAGGIVVEPTELHAVRRPDRTLVGYLVQPLVPLEHLGPTVLGRLDPTADTGRPTGGRALLASVTDAVVGAVTPTVGLDAQISNWVWVDGRLTYLDLTTPMLRSPSGAIELDTGLFLARMPWLLRPPLARFVVPGIVATYHEPRSILVDLVGNLLKERLERWLPTALDVANASLAGAAPSIAGGRSPITDAEVRRYYTSDKRMWGLLQAVSQTDRAWQRRVRRRPYEFLLPGPIER